MKVLVFSLDKNLLFPDSRAGKRVAAYSLIADAYHVLIPSESEVTIYLSDFVKVWGSGGDTKVVQIYKLIRQAVNLMRGIHYNLISVQDQYFLGGVALILGWWYKIPVEVQVHGFEKYAGLRKSISQVVLKRANLIRTVSLRYQRRLLDNFYLNESIVKVVPVHVDLSGIHFSGFKGSQTFINVGRMVPIKNQRLLLEAFSLLVKDFSEAKLWLVGDGPERLDLEQYSKKLGLNGRVVFWGEQKDVGSFLKQADYFVLSSDDESWGLAVLEAAAAGLVIIMTDVGCAGEIIHDQENGIVVPPRNTMGLAAAMRKVLSDNDLSVRLGEMAKKTTATLPNQRELLYKTLGYWQTIARA